MKSPRTPVAPPRRAGRALVIATLLVGCAQPAAAPSSGAEFVYDGLDHSWSSDGSALQPLTINPGDNNLSYETWTSATSGWGPIERNRSNGERNGDDGGPLSIGGVRFDRGFGAHANSAMTFALAGQCREFTASVGLDDEVGQRGSVVFQVYGDGTKLYDSGVMRGTDGARALGVDVSGKDELRLVVTDAGDGISHDHADWGSPMLRTCTPGANPPPQGQVLDLTPAEQIFSGVVNSTGAPQAVTLRNRGSAPLRINSVELTGKNAADFRLVNPPAWPLTLPPGASAEVATSFTPNEVGALQAALRVTSDALGKPAQTVGLYGLSARGEQGNLEPPLAQIVQTLGYDIDVGGKNLILGTGPGPIGDEVLAPLFTKAGPGPVTLRPVARYSPDDPLPFGYYTPGSGSPALHPVAEIARGGEQRLNPPVSPGGRETFDPGSATFGLYVGATSYAPQNSYTQDELNTARVEHAARIYPLNNRAGQPLENSYLVAFEPAVNGDYQDYVFVVSNVKPAARAETGLRWTPRADALKAVSEAQGAAVNGRLYVFGGFDSALRATTRSQSYDPAADRWADVTAMPEPVTHGAVAVDGTTVYIAGGFVGNHPGPQTDRVWKYNAATDAWSAGVPLPAARGGGALVRLGRELHFFGGVERNLSNTSIYLRDSADHWVLNLDGGSAWRSAAPMPNPRNHTAGVALGGQIYAIGGQHLGDEQAGNQASVDRYDPSTDTWTPRANLPLPLGHINASTLVWNGRIVVVAGVTQKSLEVANVSEYNPATDTWTALTPLPAARQSPVADVIGGELIVTGGSLPSGAKATTWVGTR
ncbi:glycosyl hydrolase family protein [Deinococcus aerius]|uniref:Glycosyl hydrolase family protein n=1 Tax=Deinococcus aerius TaxID=200253 RepID=A0A2I9E071_9DEIO|nr:NPCBM/NEW2 domain-containing protein [Deinococcus aerius]GBF06815.1 glycosyl hydrolase family protein [Deinococcus aerius]